MKKKAFMTNKGYSLLETVVYVAILAIIFVAVFDMLAVMSKSFGRVRANNEVRLAGTAAMERMAREIRTASSSNVPSSVFNAHPGYLVLNTTDDASVAKTVEFYFNSTTKSVNIDDNGNDKGALHGGGGQVTNLVFRTASSTKGQMIKIEMTIQSKKESAVSIKFYDTIVMRGGY